MKTFFGVILFLFVLTTSQTLAQETNRPGSQPADQQVLREILLELKQLRSVIARTNVNQLRFQTTFDQYKIQQSRVDMMNRELDSVKNQLNAPNPLRGMSEDQVKTLEERLLQTTDPRQRQNLERQIQTIKRNLEAQDQREKRLKDRQTTLESQIPYEQSKLEQLNSELERIKQDINSLLNQ